MPNPKPKQAMGKVSLRFYVGLLEGTPVLLPRRTESFFRYHIEHYPNSSATIVVLDP
jgi:hypothetical protein